MPVCELPPPTDDILEGKRNLDEYGITIHKNCLSPDQLSALKARLEEQAMLEREYGLATFSHDDSDRNIVDDYFKPFIGRPVGLPAIQKVTLLVNKGREFIDLAKHPIFMEYARHVFRSLPFNMGAQLGLILRKGAPAQPLHTDQSAVPFQTPFPLSVNAMVALGEYEADMGSTRLVPKSHKLPPEAIAQAPTPIETVPAVMEPGSALIWESRVWHGQGCSTSDKTRYSILNSYVVFFAKTLECHPTSIHDGVYETLSEDELALFGFDWTGYGRVGPRNAADNRATINQRLPYIPHLSAGAPVKPS